MKKSRYLLLGILCLTGCSQAVMKEAEGTYLNDKGETATARIKMKDDKLSEVELDESTGDTTKKTLKDDYHMKIASGIGKEWWEQAQFFEQYVQKNGISGITLNDEGKAENPDVLSGCTIRIDGFLKAIEDAQNNIESQK